MRSAIVLASLVSVVAAQNYGRFPCTIVNGDNTLSPDPNQCLDGNLVAPGADTGNGDGTQGDGVTPTGATCTQAPGGQYFCGIAGAPCTVDLNCDNGSCGPGGVCVGGPGTVCGGDDTVCSGYLYCNDPDFNPTASNTCGAVGAFCQDYTLGDPTLSDDENRLLFSPTCASGFCARNGACATVVNTDGGSCEIDPAICGALPDGTDLVCTLEGTASVCRALAAPSGLARARSRRNVDLAKKSLCPASHTACSLEGTKGFECIDTQSNLEQCGACASAGGVDCTQLEGVDAVGCVAGTCEVWSCLDGYRWDDKAAACVASLA